jgi:hypothetical protein
VKFSRPAAARWARCCQGGSLVQGESTSEGWVEGGSVRRAVDDCKLSGGWELDDGVDQQSPVVAFGSQENGVP